MAKAKLAEYTAKRKFEATPEPAPAAVEARSGPLLFVVQQHSARRLHYDFRLEAEGVLKSWAVPKGPSLNPADKRLAVPTEDHPFEYASFEGAIPAGQYGAGEVIVWDCGVYSPDEDGKYRFHDRAEAERRVMAGIEKGKLSIFLRGEKLKGSFALVRTSDGKNWLLIKHKDRFAQEADISERRESILSGIGVEDLKRLPARERLAAARLSPAGPAEALPKKLSPMLAQAGEKAFSDPAWLHEPKLDGYRVLAFIEDGKVELRSRKGLDLTPLFPSVVAGLSNQAVSTMVLDGEIVAFEDGKPSFNALQNRAQLRSAREIATAEREAPCVFFCFDLLHFAGVNLRGAPYEARRRWLAQCLLPSPRVQLVHAEEDGIALYKAALASGFEGAVAKRRDSRYEPGRRSASWLKIKATKSAEFLVGGYTKGKGSREPLGALLLGYWAKKGELRYAGNVGSGFDEVTLATVKQRCEDLRSAKSPFAEKPPVTGTVTWVKPELVAEVKFAEWTPDGHLRAPVFLRLRDDVDPKGVARSAGREEAKTAAAASAWDRSIAGILRQLEDKRQTLELVVGAEKVRLTHLDRVYWPADAALGQPALTKRDLLRYLARVSQWMLPHLAGRLMTLIRMPEGIHGERFYQKRWEQAPPPRFVETVSVFSEHKGRHDEYFVCNNLATLLWLAQHGTLEFHVTHSRVTPGADAKSREADFATSLETLERSVLNYPDYLVFDLDPYIYSGSEAPGAEPELNTAAFEKTREAAFRLRELLVEMSLDPLVKTSGKTGLHVYVPIERTLDFDTARHVCETVFRHLTRKHPKELTMEWATGKRTGKVFMDWSMNVRGKTLNAAYSPRGLPGAPVSMPLTWEGLAKAHPLDFRITNVISRLERNGDKWQNIAAKKQNLEKTWLPDR